MTKEEIETRLNYLVDFAVDNPNVNNPQMMTNCADDILKYIDQLQQENEELKTTIKGAFWLEKNKVHSKMYIDEETRFSIERILKND